MMWTVTWLQSDPTTPAPCTAFSGGSWAASQANFSDFQQEREMSGPSHARAKASGVVWVQAKGRERESYVVSGQEPVRRGRRVHAY